MTPETAQDGIYYVETDDQGAQRLGLVVYHDEQLGVIKNVESENIRPAWYGNGPGSSDPVMSAFKEYGMNKFDGNYKASHAEAVAVIQMAARYLGQPDLGAFHGWGHAAIDLTRFLSTFPVVGEADGLVARDIHGFVAVHVNDTSGAKYRFLNEAKHFILLDSASGRDWADFSVNNVEAIYTKSLHVPPFSNFHNPIPNLIKAVHGQEVLDGTLFTHIVSQ